MSLTVIYILPSAIGGIRRTFGDFHNVCSNKLQNVSLISSLTENELFPVKTGENDYLHLRVINPSTLPFTYRLSPGQIGPHFNTTFTSTSLVLTEPPHACELVSNAHEVNRNIALIIRGFVTKAINAHVAGAVAVIVYDFNRKAIHTFSMIQDDTSRRVQIPCAFMNGKDGHSITTALDNLNLTKALVDFPVNVSVVPVYHLRLTPWTLW